MKFFRLFLGLLAIFVVMGANAQKRKKKEKDIDYQSNSLVEPNKPVNQYHPEDAFILSLLKSYPGYFDSVLAQIDDNRVQIIYTQINRDKANNPILKHFYFNRQGAKYFYPASTVKLPIVLLALEKLGELNVPGVDKYATMITEAAYSGQTPQYNEPNSPEGKPTIANYIRQILMVSDNNAYNRLYEFLGQKYINDRLRQKGYLSAQILHRLDVFLSEDENRHTNPVRFLGSQGEKLWEQPLQYNRDLFEKRKDSLGNAYYSGGVLVGKPMVFSGKNRLSLYDLHSILQSIIFPETLPEKNRFNLPPSERDFVLKNMSQFPGESIFPSYDTGYYDAYTKFLLLGAEKEPVPANLRISNKVGDAYGHLIDAAYIVDFDKKIEFMLSAVMYCNSDGVLNDDKYDYEKMGLPFMKHLGQVFYDYEVKRKKQNLPDLSAFRFAYDKPSSPR